MGSALPGLPRLEAEAEAEDLLRTRFGKHRSVRRLDRELRAAMAAGIRSMSRSIS